MVAGGLALLGISSLAVSLSGSSPLGLQAGNLLLAIACSAAIVAADQFPIHILRGAKVSFVNLPIFLGAVLLPAPLAILAAGIGLLISNLIARLERGLYARDIAMTVGQWMFTSFLGTLVIHQIWMGPPTHGIRFLLLILCALVFLLVDFSIFSLCQSLIYGEPFFSTLWSLVKEGIAFEAIQYLIAILGALAAFEEIWSVLLLAVPIVITYVAFKNMKEMHSDTVHLLENMADTVDLRDRYTGGHSKRVAEWTQRILLQMSIAGPEATIIVTAARLHDIGKIGMPDSILNKPGKLLPEEIPLMQTHSQKGAELIEKYRDFSRGAVMIKHHHERWDGTGYPGRLKAYEIPFGARVIAVADGFDAMTSDRPYRAAMTAAQAIQILLEGRDKQWDGRVVDALVRAVTAEGEEQVREAAALKQVINGTAG